MSGFNGGGGGATTSDDDVMVGAGDGGVEQQDLVETCGQGPATEAVGDAANDDAGEPLRDEGEELETECSGGGGGEGGEGVEVVSDGDDNSAGVDEDSGEGGGAVAADTATATGEPSASTTTTATGDDDPVASSIVSHFPGVEPLSVEDPDAVMRMLRQVIAPVDGQFPPAAAAMLRRARATRFTEETFRNASLEEIQQFQQWVAGLRDQVQIAIERQISRVTPPAVVDHDIGRGFSGS